ncbi:HNH endonuclease signature motif containing protein [Aeromonas dhakensis]|uniref:HNH endonuclease signature motif containing protein n=1 Tax=Aeromonas dhakensis TaxID=196024 RepID=UPI003EE34734
MASEHDHNKEVYWTRKWRAISKQHRQKNPLCLHCKQKGIYSPAFIVDHLIEIEDDWSRRFDKTNLQSLCLACHNTKTEKEQKKRKSTGAYSPSDIINWALGKGKK